MICNVLNKDRVNVSVNPKLHLSTMMIDQLKAFVNNHGLAILNDIPLDEAAASDLAQLLRTARMLHECISISSATPL
jgi:hypothetical protein